jgi:hypothetical protein
MVQKLIADWAATEPRIRRVWLAGGGCLISDHFIRYSSNPTYQGNDREEAGAPAR